MRPRVAIADQAGRVIVQRDLARERRAGLLRTEEEGKEVGRGAFFQKGAKLFCMRVLYRKTTTEWKNSSSSSSAASAVVAKTGGDSFRRSLSKDFSTCNGEKK